MKQSAQKHWKGCALCKPHKLRTQGDTERTKHAVRKRFGVKRRYSRTKTYGDEA